MGYRKPFLIGSIFALTSGGLIFSFFTEDYSESILLFLSMILTIMIGYTVLLKAKAVSFWKILMLTFAMFQLWPFVLFGISNLTDLKFSSAFNQITFENFATMSIVWNLYFGYIGIYWLICIVGVKFFISWKSKSR